MGERTLEIVDITVDGFYSGYIRNDVLDVEYITTNCCIWLHCKCDDTEFLSQNYDHSDTLKEILKSF